MKNNLTFDSSLLENFIKDELSSYIKAIDGLEDCNLQYQDNISIEQPVFPCYAFEIFSQGVVESKIDSENIENATNILLDLDLFVNDECASPLSSRDYSNKISYGIAKFINEKLGMKISQNDRVPNSAEYIFRKKIRATGVFDNEENTIYTK